MAFWLGLVRMPIFFLGFIQLVCFCSGQLYALYGANLQPKWNHLAKMAVSPKAQEKNIGWLLGQAALDKARELGAQKVFLESNTILKPAINLYHKLGFQKITGYPSPYERSNIQMAITL